MGGWGAWGFGPPENSGLPGFFCRSERLIVECTAAVLTKPIASGSFKMRDFQIFKAVMFLCEFMPAGFVTPSWR